MTSKEKFLLFKQAVSPHLDTQEWGEAIMYLGMMTRDMTDDEIRRIFAWAM